jgi:outer membrane protein OmpA-like peptidoglycan-associated protein
MAMGTLDKAAESFKAGGVSRVTVTGYADTVGNVKSNQELSERRAYAVRGALYTRGVPVDAMTVIANGEDKLVVKTADETAEARNRVVTIRLK